MAKQQPAHSLDPFRFVSLRVCRVTCTYTLPLVVRSLFWVLGFTLLHLDTVLGSGSGSFPVPTLGWLPGYPALVPLPHSSIAIQVARRLI